MRGRDTEEGEGGGRRGLTESALLEDRRVLTASVGRSPDKQFSSHKSDRRVRNRQEGSHFVRREAEISSRVFWLCFGQQELLVDRKRAAEPEEML